MWRLDHTYDGFKWVDCGADNPCTFAYTRTDGKTAMLIVLNFSDSPAVPGLKMQGRAELLLDTDWEPFGGQTRREPTKASSHAIPPYSGRLYAICPK